MKTNNKLIRKHKKKILEHFNPIEGGSQSENSFAGFAKTSFTKTGFCTGAAGGGSNKSISSNSPNKPEGGISIVPNQDQMSSEFSKFNPIWIAFPILNLIIDIFIMIWDVFMYVFQIVFFKTYELIVPNNFDFGLKAGKKYCLNLLTWRMLVTFLCPPAGVFMAYGLRGFVQIGICALLSLFFYVPGLVYGLVVILRSDVAEYIEQVELDVCQDNSEDGLFFSSDEEKAKCSRDLGDSCSVDGQPLPGNPMKLDCCAQPERSGDEGAWSRNGSKAKDAKGDDIKQYSEGELMCKVDFKTKLAPTKGICVFKSTGGIGKI
jgi:uncharacterized membrane protein YqaE (UPF0057 family)